MAGQYDLYTKVGKYLKKSDKKPSATVVVDSINRPPIAQNDGSRSYAVNQDIGKQPVGVVHQNEGVLSQKAMDNLGKDTFVALAKKAEDGTVDLNKIRTSVGLSELPGYDQGGVVQPVVDPVKQARDAIGGGVSTLAQRNSVPSLSTPSFSAPSAPSVASTTEVVSEAPKTKTTQVQAPQAIVAPSTTQSGTVVPVASTTTPLSTTGTPAITSEDAYRTAAADYLHDVMTGKNKTQKNIADQTLNDLAARQQYSGAALNQSMAQNPNLTEGAKTTLTAQEQAQQSAETAKTEGSLAINAQNAANTAATNLYTGSLAGEQFQLQARQQELTDAERNVSDYIMGHTNPDGTYNGDPNDPAYQSLIGNVYTQMTGQPASSMTAAWAKSYTDGIAKQYATTFTVSQVASNMVSQGLVPSQYLDSTTGQPQAWVMTDLQNTIRDAMTSGILDSTGKVVSGQHFSLPWNNPDTMYKYKDWNGNDIALGTDINSPEYRSTFVTDPTTGQPSTATFGQLTDKWKALAPSLRDQYMNRDGTVNITSLIDSLKPITTTTGTVTPVSVTYLTNKLLDPNNQNPDYVSAVQTFITQSSGMKFNYVDQNGVLHDSSDASKMPLSSTMLATVYQQFDQYYNQGKGDLGVAKFQALYGDDGSKWIIDTNGSVLNFTNQAKYGTESGSQYQWDGTTGFNFLKSSDISNNISTFFNTKGAGTGWNSAGMDWVNNNKGKQIVVNGKSLTINGFTNLNNSAAITVSGADGNGSIIYDYVDRKMHYVNDDGTINEIIS